MSKTTWKKSIFAQFSNELNNTTTTTTNSENVKGNRTLKRSFSENSVGQRKTENESENILNNKQTKAKPVDKQNVSSNWEIYFAPKKLEDLAIHPKKLEELHNWFRHCDHLQKLKNKIPQICLLTGPSGSGKTAAVRILAEVEQYELLEWINPIDQEQILGLGDQLNKGYMTSQIEMFKSFLLRASRYKSVLDTQTFNRSLLMVEDFPNMLLNDAELFKDILKSYRSYGKSPLIFICSDSKTRGLNISYNLFTDPIKQQFQIEHICLNSIAATILNKAMKRFCNLMRAEKSLQGQYTVPTLDVVDSIATTAQGDIRNALLSLHFAALKGAANIKFQRTASENLLATKPKRKKKDALTLKSMGRNESVTFLHGIGRVLNPKFDSKGKLTHDPGSMAENFLTEPQRTMEFLFRNYLPHFSNLEQVIKACDGLALADSLHAKDYSERCDITTLTVDLAVRSMMVNNKLPQSGWHPVHGPVRWWETKNAKESQSSWKQFSLEHTQRISESLYAVDYAHFVKVILSQEKKV